MSVTLRNEQTQPANNELFLRRLRVDHEPVSLLGRYFLQVAAAADAHNISLSVETVEDLVDINGRNQDEWRRVLPLFDPRLNDLDENNTFVLVARNQDGLPVATGACRLFEWQDTNYTEELESLRIFSEEARAGEQEYARCSVSAKRSNRVTGRVVFAGAAWCHPSVRGQSLSSLIPRTSKALALAKWDFDHMIGLMLEDVLARGFAKRFGYEEPERGAVLVDKAGIEKHFAVLSMSRGAVVNHVDEYLTGHGSKVDRVVGQRLP